MRAHLFPTCDLLWCVTPRPLRRHPVVPYCERHALTVVPMHREAEVLVAVATLKSSGMLRFRRGGMALVAGKHGLGCARADSLRPRGLVLRW